MIWLSAMPTALRLSRYSAVVVRDHRVEVVVAARELQHDQHGVLLLLRCRHSYASSCPFDPVSAELIFARRHDQLQHLGGALGGVLGVRVAVPADLAPLLRLLGQLLLGVGADLDRAQQVEAAVDQLLRRRACPAPSAGR